MEGNYYQHYDEAREKLKKEINEHKERYVTVHSRKYTSAIRGEAFQALKQGKCLTEWKGVRMWKDPASTTIYQTMLWEIQPATVIEIGAYRGGSALWLADHLKLFDINARVLSMDKDISKLDLKVKENENITFIESDCYKIKEAFTAELLQNLPHPWIIIDDCHVNVSGMLGHFYRHMKAGDYFIAEDSHPDTANTSLETIDSDFIDLITWGPVKMKAIGDFCREHGDGLRVDTRYNDMFGYNGTWNVNGILRKM